MRSIGTSGIILKKQNRGEYDQSITLFSPELGKIRATAKGARKMSSKFSGHLETLNICDLQLHRSAHSFTITQCQARKTYRLLREKLEKSILSMLILEIFQASTHAQEQGRELFELIESTLDSLGASGKHPLVIESFKIKLLKLLGVMPEIERCSYCHKKWLSGCIIRLDDEGHLACTGCAKPHKSAQEVPFKIVKLISYIGNNGFEGIMKISLSEDEIRSLKKICRSFLALHLDREIFSEKLLNCF